MSALTRGQRQVIALVARGYTNDQIARELVCAVATIKNHIHSIHERLGTGGSRTELAAWWNKQYVEAARDEGYARGFRHGYVDGLAAGRAGDNRTAPAFRQAGKSVGRMTETAAQ
jgi:DNA-binding CsgD family transcriptional regulator